MIRPSLTLTGTRLRAGLGLRWDQLNLEDGYYFVLPGQEGWKRFTGVLPLSDVVCELLRVRQGRRRETDGGYVFPKRHGTQHPPHQSKVSDALALVSQSVGYRLTAHDLRRTFATVAKVALRDTEKVGALLTHRWAADAEGMAITQGAITRQYISNELVSLRAYSNRAVNLLLELAGRRPMSSTNRALIELEGYDPRAFALLDFSKDGTDEESVLAALIG